LGFVSNVSLGRKKNPKSSERKSKYLGNEIKEVLDAINVVHPFKERSAQ
jgi:fido (protein-threonine AMPylation protein)